LPTRELAAQCHSVIETLAKYCNNIRAALVLGGLSLSQQTYGSPNFFVFNIEDFLHAGPFFSVHKKKKLTCPRVELRQFPDIIVATPGRILDHLRNTQSFSLEDLEILVMDEADRLLEMGFTEEVEEIVKQCPKGIHNMLFSATMTEEVSPLHPPPPPLPFPSPSPSPPPPLPSPSPSKIFGTNLGQGIRVDEAIVA
jgi:ATP-dependent RNA helicase DDX27